MPAPQPVVASSCAPTYAESKAQILACDERSPKCAYAEGSCACMPGCVGGPIPPPNYRPPMHWECAPKVCSTTITEGAACAIEGTHCGRCYDQLWDCKNGKWLGSERPVPP